MQTRRHSGGSELLTADAPSTTLLRRVVPLPRFAGQDEDLALGRFHQAHRRIGNVVGSTHQLGGGYTYYSHAARFEPGVASFIALGPIAHVVTCSVDFDRKPRLGTIEIEYVWSNRMLATEHRLSCRALAQSAP